MTELIPSKAPNLQVPPQQYSAAQQQFLVNQLKIYFNQLDSLNALLIQQDNSLNVLNWISTGNG
jgi:hypothetical protein